MAFDFDTPIDRRNTGSLKWDVSDNELPMWVADMDFAACPAVIEAIQKRVAHGVFGYSVIPDAWAEAYVAFWKERHGFALEKDWLIFCTGVVPAISSAVRKLTTPGENVLILTPVYNIFFNSILNNGRKPLECPLTYRAGRYDIDWQALEEGLADPQTSLLIFCNPHNPIGKIWDKPTLAKIGELCRQYGVTVFSDEIHCDLTAPGKSYIPFASASSVCQNISVTAIAPTKAFNLAGIQSAAVVVPNPFLRHKMWRALNTDEVAEPNGIAIPATLAALTKGAPWLDELRAYIEKNRTLTAAFIQKELPMLMLIPSEATYLLWLDCRKVSDSGERLAEAIRASTGLYLSAGEQYGKGGEGFLRVNIACPKSRLLDGLARLKQGIETFVKTV